MTLPQHADDIYKMLAPLPAGFAIEADPMSDVLIVRGPTLGFAVTHAQLEDNRLGHVKPCFDHLKKLEGEK